MEVGFPRYSTVFADAVPANIWSFGLLGLHNGKPIEVHIDFSKDANTSCRKSNLTIGEEISDMLIGNALADMTSVLAEKDGRYNTSHWCYMRKLPNLENKTFTRFDNNFFSTYSSLEYVCCEYNTWEESKDPVWCDVPNGLGFLMLLFFPLIFLKAIGHGHKKNWNRHQHKKGHRPYQRPTYTQTVDQNPRLSIYQVWFLAVACSCCPYLYFRSAIMLVTYFVNFR